MAGDTTPDPEAEQLNRMIDTINSVPAPGTPAPPADSGITPEDVARAQAAWRKNASPRFKGLLDAKPTQKKPKRGR